MKASDEFRTLTQSGTGEFKSKGSRFIAYAYPIKSRDEIKRNLEALKKEHFKSRHVCYAYRLGIQGDEYRANDDGEPSGSAGLPILNAMKSHEIVNAMVAVVRYFGGTKLGIPGLIEAYKTSAEHAIVDALPKIDHVYSHYQLHINYDILGPLMEAISQSKSSIKEQAYDENPFIQLITRQSNLKADLNQICTKLIGYEVIDYERFELENFKIELLGHIEGTSRV